MTRDEAKAILRGVVNDYFIYWYWHEQPCTCRMCKTFIQSLNLKGKDV
jgi:hypothetical protein